MAANYPMHTTNGTENTYTYRFAKFENSTEYDPLVHLDPSPPPGDGEDMDKSSAGIMVRFKGNSGKFEISRVNETDKIEVFVDAVTERDSAGVATGNKLSQMASSKPKWVERNVDLGNNVTATQVTLTSELKKAPTVFGTLELITYIIESKGQVGLNASNASKFSVEDGTVKFNLRLSTWSWDTNGELVDVAVSTKGLKEATDGMRDDGSNETDLGGGATLVFNREVLVDGVLGTIVKRRICGQHVYFGLKSRSCINLYQTHIQGPLAT